MTTTRPSAASGVRTGFDPSRSRQDEAGGAGQLGKAGQAGHERRRVSDPGHLRSELGLGRERLHRTGHAEGQSQQYLSDPKGDFHGFSSSDGRALPDTGEASAFHSCNN